MTEVYRDWINSLKDRAGRARVQVRVGPAGSWEPGTAHGVLTDGECELKIDFGPGYRQQDIETAIALAKGL